LLSFIKASLDKLEGPSHHWLNRDFGNKQLFKDKGTYVVLAGHLLDGTSDLSGFFEKLKLLQQRFKKAFIFVKPKNNGNLTAITAKYLF
jgi:hypothetical protein